MERCREDHLSLGADYWGHWCQLALSAHRQDTYSVRTAGDAGAYGILLGHTACSGQIERV